MNIYQCQEHGRKLIILADETQDLQCPVCLQNLIGEEVDIETAQKSVYELLKTTPTSATPSPQENMRT